MNQTNYYINLKKINFTSINNNNNNIQFIKKNIKKYIYL